MNIAKKLGYIKLEEYDDLANKLDTQKYKNTVLDDAAIKLRHDNHNLKQVIKKGNKLMSTMEYNYANIDHRLIVAKYIGTPLCLMIGGILVKVMV